MTPAARPHNPRLAASRPTALVAALMTSGLLAAACGSSSPGTPARPGTATTDAAGQVVAFAACMRSHGLPSYPDPKVSTSGNHVSIKIGPGGLDPNSPAFKAGSRACGHLLPGGGSPSPMSPQQQAQDLAYAGCMRSHGVPSFPDPDHDAVFTLAAGVDQQAPQFQHATQACMKVQPSSLSINNQNPGGS